MDPTARAIQHVITQWNVFSVVDLAARRRARWLAKHTRPMPKPGSPHIRPPHGGYPEPPEAA